MKSLAWNPMAIYSMVYLLSRATACVQIHFGKENERSQMRGREMTEWVLERECWNYFS